MFNNARKSLNSQHTQTKHEIYWDKKYSQDDAIKSEYDPTPEEVYDDYADVEQPHATYIEDGEFYNEEEYYETNEVVDPIEDAYMSGLRAARNDISQGKVKGISSRWFKSFFKAIKVDNAHDALNQLTTLASKDRRGKSELFSVDGVALCEAVLALFEAYAWGQNDVTDILEYVARGGEQFNTTFNIAKLFSDYLIQNKEELLAMRLSDV